ncbi:MAG: hypothetical protein WCR46_08260 [Deltaproteobacteria bacterium]
MSILKTILGGKVVYETKQFRGCSNSRGGYLPISRDRLAAPVSI